VRKRKGNRKYQYEELKKSTRSIYIGRVKEGGKKRYKPSFDRAVVVLPPEYVFSLPQ